MKNGLPKQLFRQSYYSLKTPLFCDYTFLMNDKKKKRKEGVIDF